MAALGKTIDLTQQLSDDLHATVLTAENLQQVTDEINDDISNLDDFIRPLKNYFYWEPHCFDIPMCWAFRSLFDGLDGIDALDVADRATPSPICRPSTRCCPRWSPS